MSPWEMVQRGHRYEIVGLVPRVRGGGYLRKHHKVARCRDEVETLQERQVSVVSIEDERVTVAASGTGRKTSVRLDVFVSEYVKVS